jgi:hypothetical protein
LPAAAAAGARLIAAVLSLSDPPAMYSKTGVRFSFRQELNLAQVFVFLAIFQKVGVHLF